MKKADTITEAIRLARVYLPFFAGEDSEEQQFVGFRDHLRFLDRECDKSQAKRVAQADAGNFQWPQEFIQRDMDQLTAAGGHLVGVFQERQRLSSGERLYVGRCEALFRSDPEFEKLMDVAERRADFDGGGFRSVARVRGAAQHAQGAGAHVPQAHLQAVGDGTSCSFPHRRAVISLPRSSESDSFKGNPTFAGI